MSIGAETFRLHCRASAVARWRSFEVILAALREFSAETVCVILDATPALLHRLRDWPIRVFGESLNSLSLGRQAIGAALLFV